MSVTFGDPRAALIALVGLLPLAVALAKGRTARTTRRALGLADPSSGMLVRRLVYVVSFFVLIGAAAAQPAVRSQRERVARTDSEVILAIDNSRSMLASSGSGPPRFARAIAFANRMSRELPSVPMGLSSFTNRLLPYLFPTTDRRDFSRVLQEAYAIESPPPSLAYASFPGATSQTPARYAKWTTTFAALNTGATQAFFRPTAVKRVLVVLSDAETQDFAARRLLAHLRNARILPLVVRFWRPGERIVSPSGATEPYRPLLPDELARLRDAGWLAFDERDASAVLEQIKRELGSGPTAPVAYDRHDTPIASALAVAALAPLLVLVLLDGTVPGTRPFRSGRWRVDTKPVK